MVGNAEKRAATKFLGETAEIYPLISFPCGLILIAAFWQKNIALLVVSILAFLGEEFEGEVYSGLTQLL